MDVVESNTDVQSDSINDDKGNVIQIIWEDAQNFKSNTSNVSLSVC